MYFSRSEAKKMPSDKKYKTFYFDEINVYFKIKTVNE
jgi:hypothetical protein